MVDKGNHEHTNAVELCKKLNARLPLPRNKEEADEFIKISGKNGHMPMQGIQRKLPTNLSG